MWEKEPVRIARQGACDSWDAHRGASWVCQQALPCTWASVGLVMSSFFRKHMVRDSVHLSPDMWSETLILCNAGEIGAVLWPLRGDEGCSRIAG